MARYGSVGGQETASDRRCSQTVYARRRPEEDSPGAPPLSAYRTCVRLPSILAARTSVKTGHWVAQPRYQRYREQVSMLAPLPRHPEAPQPAKPAKMNP